MGLGERKRGKGEGKGAKKNEVKFNRKERRWAGGKARGGRMRRTEERKGRRKEAS